MYVCVCVCMYLYVCVRVRVRVFSSYVFKCISCEFCCLCFDETPPGQTQDTGYMNGTW